MKRSRLRRTPMVRRYVEISSRILSKTVRDGECLTWAGKTMENGYAVISWHNKRWLAHRAIWTDTVGPIPDGLTIDHLCRNRACVNVAHMEVVTRAENSERGGGLQVAWATQRARTHCKRGHQFTPENTRLDKAGRRICRTCSRASWRAWAERKGIRKPLSETRGSGHGTRYAYEAKGCRCAECVAGHEALLAGRRRPKRPPAERTHGSRSTYVAGCRCEPCKSANATYARSKRRNTGPDAATVRIIRARSGDRCELCGEREATQTHHRTPRGLGSTRDPRINSPANLMRLDAECHEYVERNRAEALIAGWLVSRYSDPAKVPVLIHNGSRYVNLSADGRYLDPEEVPV